MKKFLIVLFAVLIFGSQIFSQSLNKLEFLNKSLKKKRDLPLNKLYKISATSFVESFESTTFPPDGWEVYNFDGGDGWSQQTVGTQLPGWPSGTISTPTGGGNAVAYCTYNSGTTYNDQSLITPLIEDIQLTDTLFFWTRNQLGRADSIDVYFYSDTTFFYVGGIYYPNTGGINTNWQKWYISLADWIPVGSSGFIEFNEYIEDNENNGGAICLDLVEIKGLDINVDIPSVTTNNATNITSNSATLNGTVNPNGSNTTVYFSYGTTTSYGTDITAKESPVIGSSDVNVTADITGLQPNTTYHFECYGDNNTWLSSGGDITFTTTDAATPEVDLEWRSLSLSEFNWKIGASISAEIKVFNNGISTAPAQLTQLYLSTNSIIDQTDTPLGSQLSFSEILAGDSSIVNTVFMVPQVNTGLYYVGAIVDVNNTVVETNEDNNNYSRNGKVIIGYPENFTINTNLAFNNPTETTSYRMIGFPGELNIPLSQIFTGKEGEDWIAYYDNGNSTDYLVEYDGSNTFYFSPGKGFWVLSKSEATINQQINSVNLENNYVSSGTYEIVFPIPLHSGWNIISNPFEVSIDWDLIKTYNGISESIHSFNVNYSESTAFEPYKAYYFYNPTDLTSLIIPYTVGGATSKNNIKDDNKGIISISLSDKDKIKSNINIGFNNNSIIGYDKLDRFIPPGDFEKYRVSIFNEKLETEYKYLHADFRKINSEQVYKISIKAPIGEFYKLNFDVSKKSDGLLTYLIDQNNNFHNLEVEKEISLKSLVDENKIVLLIGDESFINDQKDNFLPKEFVLSQNYPNPFNPTTTIQYSIPADLTYRQAGVKSETSKVKLVVYDILGRKITTLVNKQQQPGIYEIIFDASRLSSGIYYYTLKVGNFNEAKKMLLMK